MRRPLYLQILFVVLAFIVMIVSSSIHVNNILQSHLRRDAANLLLQTRLKIAAELREPEAALAAIVNTVREMILRGDSADMVHAYMQDTAKALQHKPGGFKFGDLFGYFDVFGGKYVTTVSDWEMPEDYDPTAHPWYRAAVAAGDKTAVSSISMNLPMQEHIIAYAHRIFDQRGQPLGVVCLYVPLERIIGYVADMRLTAGAYGILLNENMDIFYHPNTEYIGKNAREADGGLAQFMDEMLAGGELFERESNNYTGSLVVTFSSRLENGWFLYAVTPKAEYYQKLRDMQFMLGLLGALLASMLIVILLRVDLARQQSDEESRQKSVLLATIEREREADEHTQLMLDATPLGTTLWDGGIRLVACNQAAVNLFEMPDKEAYMERYHELSPDCQPCGRPSREKSIELAKRALEKGRSRFEWMHRTLNGEPLPCEITLIRVLYKEEHYILGYIRDLREYKHMMEKLEQREHLLNTVNHTAGLLLATENEEDVWSSVLAGMEHMGRAVDVDRVQIWQNEMRDGALHFVHKCEWLSDIGRQKTPVPIGLHFPYNATPEWESKFLRGEHINCPLSELPENTQAFLGSYDIKTIVIIPLFLQDQFWGFFSLDDCHQERTFAEEEIDMLRSGGLLIANAFLRSNMTRNIRATAAQLESALEGTQAANRAKTTFIANMSHEIRTPMNSIVGFSELALDAELSSSTREYLTRILENAEGLLQIINDILDISKIEAGKLELEYIPFDLHEVFVRCQTTIMPEAIEKGLMMHFYAEPSVGKKLLGDPIRLRQILINFLANAVKFTNFGTVKLSSSIKNSTENSVSIHFEIRDSGIGMTSEQIQKICEPFVQADSTTTRKFGGTGLGISIAKSMIEMMGGELFMESTPGIGSKFSFEITFDTIAVSSDMPSSDMVINELEKPAFEGEILLCEDNAMNQLVISEHLARVGLRTVVARNGKEGVDIVRRRVENDEKPFDLIFMDIHMPVMDGLEAASKIIKFHAKTPIVAMTANIMTDDKMLYREHGMPDCVSKPFTSQELWRCLMKYFTPVDRKTVDSNQQKQADAQLQRLSQTQFVKNYRTKPDAIRKALEMGDSTLAHRLAHTLKNNAGQIGKTKLHHIAADAERMLQNGKAPSEEHVELLEAELNAVLGQLVPLLDEARDPPKTLDTEQTLALFEQLEPMLQNRNPQCLHLLDEMHAVPGAEELIQHLENLDFKPAAAALAELRKTWMQDGE